MYLQSPAVILSSDPPPSIGLLSAYLFFLYVHIYIYVCMYLFIYLYMYEEWMKNGWKNAWEWITNEKKWIEDVQKNHFRRILDYLPQKTALGSQTWNDGYFCYCGQIVFENQLCVSCARKPILCSVSQTCFDLQARCFVTFQLLILSFPNEKTVQKTWDFGPARRNGNFSDTPGDFQKVILCFSPAL